MSYTTSQIERILDIPRWRINHAIRHHQVCEPSWFGRQRVFSESDLLALTHWFVTVGR